MDDDLKRCSKCGIEKDLSEFNFRKDTQNYRNQCRIFCNKLINKEYRTMNKDKIKIRSKEYRNKTKNKKRLSIDYRESNRDKIQLYKKNYFQKN